MGVQDVTAYRVDEAVCPVPKSGSATAQWRARTRARRGILGETDSV